MYIRVSDNKYPYKESDFRKDNPSTSFPPNALIQEAIRSDYGIEAVQSVERPAYKPGWNIAEESPQLDGSTWKQVWTQTVKDVSKVSSDEIQDVPEPVVEGFSATLSETPILDGDVWKQDWQLVEKTWLDKRIDAYGWVSEQIEFITENGLEAWQDKVAEIKAKYPKP